MIRRLKELRVKPKDGLPMWVPFICVGMLNVEIPEKAEDMAFDARFPIRNCEAFRKSQFVRLAVRAVHSVQELVAALRASEELMTRNTVKQQNSPSLIAGCDAVPVLAELGGMNNFESREIATSVAHNSRAGVHKK
jgi:hypothetical protein